MQFDLHYIDHLGSLKNRLQRYKSLLRVRSLGLSHWKSKFKRGGWLKTSKEAIDSVSGQTDLGFILEVRQRDL